MGSFKIAIQMPVLATSYLVIELEGGGRIVLGDDEWKPGGAIRNLVE